MSRKIYVYTTDTYEKNGWYKIGQTMKSAKERVKQQDGSSCPEKLRIIKEFSVADNCTDFKIRDIIRTYPNCYHVRKEWVHCNLDDICRAINEVENGIARIDNYSMRDEQEDCCNQAIDCFALGKNRFLINGKMRLGKVFITYQIIKRYAEVSKNSLKVLVLTYKPAVGGEWANPIKRHIDFHNFAYVYAGDFDKNSVVKFDGKSNVEILFASFQDLNDFGKTKWAKAIEYKWDFIVIDEEHYGASTERAQKTLSRLTYHKEIRLSGTPFRTLSENSFDESEIFTWTYQDEQRKKAEDIEINGRESKYYWLPRMVFHTYHVDQDIVKILNDAGYSDDEGFTLQKLFGVNQKTKKFNCENAVNSFLTDLKSNKDYPFKIAAFNHSFWKLPNSVDSVNALGSLLEKHPLYKTYKIINVAGDNERDLIEVKDAIKKYPQTITLSCGRFTTGVSIPEWNAVFMLDDGKSPETYLQTIFRCQTMDESNEKQECYVFDFNPERFLEKMYDYCTITSRLNSDGEAIREFLQYANVMEHCDNRLVPVDVNRVLDLYDKKHGYIYKFASANNINVDDNNFSQVLNILSDLDKTAAAKIEKEVQTNGLTKGKNYDKLTQDKNKTINNDKIKKDLRAKAQTVLSRIPKYLFLKACAEKSVKDILSAKDILFKQVTGVSTTDFNIMITLRFLNEAKIDKNILSFVRGYQKI